MSLKNDILYELELNRDKDVSGQMLAEKFGVSRNAIWKAINILKEDGYEILSGTNKGYHLAEDSDLVSAEGIYRYLSGKNKEVKIFFHKEIDSTNNEAKRLLADGFRDVAVIVAEAQSEGRGRNGRFFYSPGGTGLYLTLLIHPETKLADTVSITTAVAVAVIRAIKRLTDKKPMIKWVNDIFIGDRKIGGILTEAVTDFESGTVHSVIIGIGINIKKSDFPEEIRDIASSLEASGITRNQIAAEIINELIEITKDFSAKLYLDEYRKYSLVIGRHIKCIRGEDYYYAMAIGIDDDGGLIIKKEDGSHDVLRSGEISIRLK